MSVITEALETLNRANPFTSTAAQTGSVITQLFNSGTALWKQMYKDFYANPVTNESTLDTKALTLLYTKANVVWNKWPDVVKKMGPYDSLSNANKAVFRNLLIARYGLDKGFVALACAEMLKMRQAGTVPDSVWNPIAAAKAEAAETALAMQQGGISGLVANVKQKAVQVGKDIEGAASTGMTIGGFLFKWRKPLIVVGLGVAGYIYARPLIHSLKTGKKFAKTGKSFLAMKDMIL